PRNWRTAARVVQKPVVVRLKEKPMRASIILMCAALCVAAFCFSSAQETQKSRRPDPRSAKPAPRAAAQNNQPGAPQEGSKAAPQATKKSADHSGDEGQKNSDAPSSDEMAIRKTAESFIQAYEKGDAKAAASHFTADAEYIDEDGDTFVGREEIEQNFARF